MLTSCNDFIDHTPNSELTPENATSAEQALNGAYASLQDIFVGKYTIVLSEFGTDEVIPFDMGWAAYSQLHYHTFSAQHEFLDNHYRLCYDGIKRANVVIDMTEGSLTNDKIRNVYYQAKFLRAIFYFDLARMYGGVPLWTSNAITNESIIMKPRASVDEVYTLITQDMEAALELPATWTSPDDKGRATSRAAQAMLARIYLQWGKAAEALEYCKMLDGEFHLYNNYADIFDPKNKNAEYENIFEIQFKHSGSWGLEGSIQHSYWGPRDVGGPTNFGGWGGFGPTQYLYDSYDDSDRRKSAFFFTEYNGKVQSPPSTKKFWDAEYGNVIEDDNLNFIMIRYADVLLMKAEALNLLDDKSDEKYNAINEVRDRAGIARITKADNLSKDQFAEVLLEERMHELCCEHLRRWDLIRFGKLTEYMKDRAGVTLQPYHVLYPIPQAAIDANDAITENNPGY